MLLDKEKSSYFCTQTTKNPIMENKKYFFAVDLGATSGRTVVGLSLIHI